MLLKSGLIGAGVGAGVLGGSGAYSGQDPALSAGVGGVLGGAVGLGLARDRKAEGSSKTQTPTTQQPTPSTFPKVNPPNPMSIDRKLRELSNVRKAPEGAAGVGYETVDKAPSTAAPDSTKTASPVPPRASTTVTPPGGLSRPTRSPVLPSGGSAISGKESPHVTSRTTPLSTSTPTTPGVWPHFKELSDEFAVREMPSAEVPDAKASPGVPSAKTSPAIKSDELLSPGGEPSSSAGVAAPGKGEMDLAKSGGGLASEKPSGKGLGGGKPLAGGFLKGAGKMAAIGAGIGAITGAFTGDDGFFAGAAKGAAFGATGGVLGGAAVNKFGSAISANAGGAGLQLTNGGVKWGSAAAEAVEGAASVAEKTTDLFRASSAVSAAAGVAGGLIGGNRLTNSRVNSNTWAQGTHPMYFNGGY